MIQVVKYKNTGLLFFTRKNKNVQNAEVDFSASFTQKRKKIILDGCSTEIQKIGLSLVPNKNFQ